jgi:hypothetical protein
MFAATCRGEGLTRRRLFRVGCGLLTLSLPDYLGLRGRAQAGRRAMPGGAGRARSCIVLFCWGGMSHLETWDPKPEAPREIRGDGRSIATATPGIRVGEYLPLLARQTGRLAIIRSMHHIAASHGKAMYWNMTGHPPPGAEQDQSATQFATRQDWPCLGSMVARQRRPPAGLPGAVQLPYPLVDDGGLQGGQNGGWLGPGADPAVVRPARGKPYPGVSRELGTAVLRLADGVDRHRLHARQRLAAALVSHRPWLVPTLPLRSFDHYYQAATDMLSNPRVTAAFDLDRESPRVRDAYGEHICGQSVLLARRLVEAGVPLVTVICGAGDLNSGNGAHWDTHRDNLGRLKTDLLPPLDRASSTLLDDLADRGRLEDTLVVWLTEFGRTPKINSNAGRDHYPRCYSVALAGGGVQGGQVYGRSDRHGAAPLDQPCGPNDLHATILHALGIPTDARLEDPFGRSFPLTDGRLLPLFARR